MTPSRHAENLLDWSGLKRVQARFGRALSGSASLLAKYVFSISASAGVCLTSFKVGLHITYFLLRNRDAIRPAVIRALPLGSAVAERLSAKCASVV